MSYLYPSSTFSYVLRNKGEDDKESIAVATQRLLKNKQLLLVKRNKRYYYIQPHEVKDSDVIQNQSQKESPEIQNNTEVNHSNKLSVDNNTSNQITNPENALLSTKQSSQRNDLEKWRKMLLNQNGL
ncbi:MAG: hypothetical protein V1701_05305 [Planctomycetota bacterium]